MITPIEINENCRSLSLDDRGNDKKHRDRRINSVYALSKGRNDFFEISNYDPRCKFAKCVTSNPSVTLLFQSTNSITIGLRELGDR